MYTVVDNDRWQIVDKLLPLSMLNPEVSPGGDTVELGGKRRAGEGAPRTTGENAINHGTLTHRDSNVLAVLGNVVPGLVTLLRLGPAARFPDPSFA